MNQIRCWVLLLLGAHSVITCRLTAAFRLSLPVGAAVSLLSYVLQPRLLVLDPALGDSVQKVRMLGLRLSAAQDA